jgi:acyl-CoA thioesterase FadM
MGGARIALVQHVRRGSDLLLAAEVEVCLISDGRPQRIPPAIRAKLEAVVR